MKNPDVKFGGFWTIFLTNGGKSTSAHLVVLSSKILWKLLEANDENDTHTYSKNIVWSMNHSGKGVCFGWTISQVFGQYMDCFRTVLRLLGDYFCPIAHYFVIEVPSSKMPLNRTIKMAVFFGAFCENKRKECYHWKRYLATLFWMSGRKIKTIQKNGD